MESISSNNISAPEGQEMPETEFSLNILWLWPDILNLHGDRGNVMALKRVCETYGIRPSITRINKLTEDFDPLAFDLILINPGELVSMTGIIEALEKKRGALDEFANGGGVIFCVGTSGAVLAKETERTDGSRIKGLGMLDMICKERSAILGDDLISEVFGEAVCGIQIQMMDTLPCENQAPLADKIIYGYGNNGRGTEGAIKNNVIFTNMLGPVLVKNPRLTLELIKRALLRKAPDKSAHIEELTVFKDEYFETELKSAAAVRKFNETKEKPKI